MPDKHFSGQKDVSEAEWVICRSTHGVMDLRISTHTACLGRPAEPGVSGTTQNQAWSPPISTHVHCWCKIMGSPWNFVQKQQSITQQKCSPDRPGTLTRARQTLVVENQMENQIETEMETTRL